MYVVTFYSYKGGVGRTLALVNIAAMLAKSGRKVLAVDFDLEAPSLPRFEIFNRAQDSSGIVDYVSSYRKTGIAPDCHDFIVPCEVEGNPIWVMPAGRHLDYEYADDLNNIDWKVLYEEQDGYLFFEDLKQQWAQYGGHGFDYVLIDSRTGHTDVGGICTRHLPDAVSVMFLPNDSNISGLMPIIENIRGENDIRSVPIDLHIVPSNVPDLDDEKGILADLLNNASKRLNDGYDFPTLIHHYQSLDILTKDAFSLSRPNSKLSRELEELRLRIIGQNLLDREGAAYTLSILPIELNVARERRDGQKREELYEQARRILFSYPDDGEIGSLAAHAFGLLGDLTEELNALGVAIDNGYDVDRSRLIRGIKLLSATNETRASVTDLVAVVRSKTATAFELIPALQALKEVSTEWLVAVDAALDRPDRQADTIMSMMGILMSWREATPLCAERLLALSSFDELSQGKRRQIRNLGILCLIAAGRFEEAGRVIEDFMKEGDNAVYVPLLFNKAIVEWALMGEPSVELFKQLVAHPEMQASNISVNGLQCLALSYAVVGDKESALENINLAKKLLKPGEVPFSCWTFLNSPSEELSEQLAEMQLRIENGVSIKPPFMELESLQK